MSNDDLFRVLKLPQYQHFKEIAPDDWRDPSAENAGFSISSRGWMDHRTNEKGSLAALLGKSVNIEKIYENSSADRDDLEIILEYLNGHRQTETTVELVMELGMRINRHEGNMSIVTPMRDIDGQIQCLHRIDLDQTFNKAQSSRLLGKSNRDRGILLRNKSKKLIQIEGLEDAIIIYQNKPDYDVLVTGPAVNFKRGKEFYKFYDEKVLLLDNDLDEASLRHSSHLGDSVLRWMPLKKGVDANLSWIQGSFDNWWDTLEDIAWDEVVSKLDEWNLKIHENIIDEFNQKLAVICVENKVVILKETYDPYLQRDKIVLWSKTDLTAWYADRFVDLIGADGKIARVSASKYWFTHTKRRKFEGFTMEQAVSSQTKNYYNLWKGLGFQAVKGDCSYFYEHMYENISSGNDDIYNYLLDWMADAVQNPLTTLPETAIVLRGEPGTGKTFFLDHFGKLFGSHYLYIRDAKYLTGSFNGHLKDAVYLFADEAFLPNKEHYRILKGLITQALTMIEFKGKDAFPFRNYIHLVIAVNDKFVLPVDIDDRRFFMLKVGNKRKKDRNYFKTIEKQLTAGGYCALLYDLLNRDLRNTNLLNFPETQTILDNKLKGLSSVWQWVFQCLCSGELPDCKLPIMDLYHKYLVFCQEIRLHIWTQPLWTSELKECFKTLKRRRISGTSQSCYCQWGREADDSLKECRQIFADRLNSKIDWELYE